MFGYYKRLRHVRNILEIPMLSEVNKVFKIIPIFVSSLLYFVPTLPFNNFSKSLKPPPPCLIWPPEPVASRTTPRLSFHVIISHNLNLICNSTNYQARELKTTSSNIQLNLQTKSYQTLRTGSAGTKELWCDVPWFLKALTPNAMTLEAQNNLRKRSLNKILDLQWGVMSILWC